MKKSKIVISLCLALLLAFSLVTAIACGNSKDKHTCEFSTEWTSDQTNHWHACTCGEKKDVAEHDWDDGVTVGTQVTYTCKVCNETKKQTIPHTCEFSTEWTSDQTNHWHACTCGEKKDVAEHDWDDGVTVGPKKTYTCTTCGETKVEEVPFNPIIEWAEGDGVTFDKNDVLYKTPEVLQVMPRAYEVWLQLPTSVSGDGGVIFGSYTGKPGPNYTKLDITAHGVPVLSVNGVSVEFSEVDVRSDDFVHLAICIDKNNSTAKCYLNGEIAQVKENVDLADTISTYPHYVGTDLTSGHPYMFKGSIKSLALFSDIRVSAEVREDMYSIDVSDENLIGAYDFNNIADGDIEIEDLSLNSFDLDTNKVWLDESEIEEVGDYAYSFAVVGDTQYIIRDNPDKFTEIYDWILDNVEERKIEYVMGLGDIVEHLYMSEANLATEWQLARNVISKMNGKVKYSLVRGNHDSSAFFNETFNNDEYLSMIDGTFDGKIDNTYSTFTVSGYQYMILNLDFEPSDEVLAWANTVVESHPNHRVIINTHSYLHHDGRYTTTQYTVDGQVGQKIWDNFASKHGNIMMVLSGHVAYDPIVVRQDKGVNGNTVTQMLIDPQDIDGHNTPTGLVAMFYFGEDGKTLTVRYYSTIRDKYFSIENQFVLDLGEWVNIGLVEEDVEQPKIHVYTPAMGVAGQTYTLPEIVVTDNLDGAITPTISVYLKSDSEKTALDIINGTFVPEQGGYYVLSITATDSVGNTHTKEVDLPIRNNALENFVLEDFESEVTFGNFTGGADAEWLETFEGANGVLHLLPNQTDKSNFHFKLFENGLDYSLPFSKITMKIWVDAEDDNGNKVSTSIYDTYEGVWKGFANSHNSGWHTVVINDFYYWDYFADSASQRLGAQLFWTWTKNTHIYIDEITFETDINPVIEVDKQEYVKGDTVSVTAYIPEDESRELEISVKAPDGTDVTITNGQFVMQTAGKYTITASLTAPYYYACSSELVIDALTNYIKVEETTNKAEVGQELAIPNAIAYNPITKQEIEGVIINTQATFNGEIVELVDGKFLSTVDGLLEIKYFATIDGEEKQTIIKVLITDNVVDFIETEQDCVVAGGEYFEEYQGAYGVVKYDISDIWGSMNTFRTHLSVEELQSKEWDKLEVKMMFVGGTNSSLPDPSEAGWTFADTSGIAPRDTWVYMQISKEQLATQFGTINNFYNSFASQTGAKFCSIWNTENSSVYVDYIKFKKPVAKFNGEQNFDDNQTTTQIFGLENKEFLATYEGAEGVIKGSYSDSWIGVQFRLNSTVEELNELNWDYIEFKMAVDFTGSRASWDGFYSNAAGWTYTTDGVWRIYKASKDGIITQFGSLENFYKAITVGNGGNDNSRLFTLWNMADHGNFYFDYVKLAVDVNKFTGNANFDNADAKTQIYGLENAEYLENYEGATGVIKGAYVDDWVGIQFRLNSTVNALSQLNWEYVEFKIAVDFTGSRDSWDGLYSNAAGWTYTTDGVWRIYKAHKDGIITQFGSLENFYKAITVGNGGNDNSRLFTLWNLGSHGNFYFDYFKLV